MFEVRSTIVPPLGAPISFTALVDTADGATLIEAALHCAHGFSAIVATEVSELSPKSEKDDGASCVLEVG